MKQLTVGDALALVLVAIAVVAMPAGILGTAAAADSGVEQNNELNWGADATPNPYIYEDSVTVSEHNRSEMSSPFDYYDDNGDVSTLRASRNESITNWLRYYPSKVDDASLSVFPRISGEDNDATSALEASEWSTVEGSPTVSDTNTVADVPSVKLATNGSMSNGNAVEAKMDNFSISNDATKRVALLVGDVDTLDSGATVFINFTESDGDTKSVKIDSGSNYGDDGVMANATGTGVVYQTKLSDLSTDGSGDGSFDAIDKITFRVIDGDATLVLNGIDVEKKTRFAWGEESKDTDSDDDNETVTHYENGAGGKLKMTGMDTLPSQFDDAAIHDFEVHGLRYEAALLESGDVYADFSSADAYPSFDEKAQVDYRLNVPGAIDLSHSGLTLKTDQALPSGRYATWQHAEDTGANEPSEVSSWTDDSGDLSDQGDTVALDTSISAGENIIVNGTVKLTADEADALRNTGGGGGGPQGTGGGIIGFLTSLPGMILALLGGFVGLRRLRNAG